MRRILVLALASATSWNAVSAAAQSPKDDPMVFTIGVVSPAARGGFIEPGDLDSTHDIQRELRSCKVLREVVATPQGGTTSVEPRVFIEVTRAIEETDGAFPTYFASLHATVSIPRSAFGTIEGRPYVKFIYKVGGYGQWRYAAKEVVRDLCNWVKTNASQLSAETASVEHF